MSRKHIVAVLSLAFSLSVFTFDASTAFAQFSRSQISPRGGDYAPRPRGGGGGFYGGYGGGFGIPIIIPTPNPRYYEPDDEDVIYERPRRRVRPQRNAPPIDIDSIYDYPPQNVRRAKQQKHKPQREIVRAHQKTKTLKAVQAPKTPRVPVPPVIVAKPTVKPPISAGVPPITETRYVQNEVVFEFKPNASPASIDQIIAANRLERIASWKFKLTDSILYRYRITDGRSVSVVIAALEQNLNISSAQPNYIYALQQAASQPVSKVSNTNLPPQYAVEIMHVKEAHKLAKGSNVLISVIDSAIDKDHPELLGTVTDTFDPVGGIAKPDAHGTAMSGALSAHGQLAGITPDAKIIAVRAFAGKAEPAEITQSGAQGTSFHVLRGLDWSYEKNARIVNMSFAGPKDPALSRMIAAAKDKRMVVIAAAGNAGSTSAPLYPAADPNVIAVAATDIQSKLYIQSNRGAYISVAAPGVDILVAAPNGAYDFSTGTSVATAHVSGVAALILQKQPNLDSDGVRKALKSTAIGLKLGDKPDTGKVDTDVVDALAALKAIGTD
jgi:Subtilase family